MAICGATGADAQGAQEDYPQNTSGMRALMAFQWDDLTMGLTYLIINDRVLTWFNHLLMWDY